MNTTIKNVNFKMVCKILSKKVKKQDCRTRMSLQRGTKLVLLINTPVVEENLFHKFIFALQDIHNYCELKFDVTITIYYNEKFAEKVIKLFAFRKVKTFAKRLFHFNYFSCNIHPNIFEK